METKYFKKGGVECHFDCDGGKILATVVIGDVWVSNPLITDFKADGWKEFTPAPAPAVEPTREEMIHSEIRERYSENDEWMILRHYASNPSLYASEFSEYNAFVESIIAKYTEDE